MKLLACQECKRQWDVSHYQEGQKLRCVCNFVMEVLPVRSYAPETHHCEACGAARPSGRGPCQYCGAVPTLDAARLSLVCPLCLHRTADQSRFCSSCGKPIEPATLDARTGKLICPRCRRPRLVNRKIGDFVVDECPGCSGMWIAATAFNRIVDSQAKRQANALGSVGGESHQPRKYSVGTDEVVYIKCPVCDRIMHRRNFGRASGVIIDECRADGVWLDCDELEKIAAFVVSGGLDYGRQILLEEQSRDARRVSLPPAGWAEVPVLESRTFDPMPLGSVLKVLRALLG